MAKSASLLDSFVFTDAKKPGTAAAVKTDPVTKFIEGIARQIGYVNETMAGNEPTKEGGKKPRIWWWFDDKKGTFFLKVYYGVSPLNLRGQGETIQLGKDLASVKKALETILEVARTGELDTLVKSTAEAASKARAAGKAKTS